jgi:hypothetical protein
VEKGKTTSNAEKPIIRAEGLSNVFGRRRWRALELRRSGTTKAESEKETGSTIGVLDASFEVYRGETFVVISGGGKDSSLFGAIDRDAPKVKRETPLRDVLPLFVERDLPVAVTSENGRLEGAVVRGSLIAELTTGTERTGERESFELEVGQGFEGGT